jgi:phage tail P2-like protein
MTNIQDLKLDDLLPSSIKNDEAIKSLAKALDVQNTEVTKAIEGNKIIPKIDQLEEMLVDLLAWQFHVDFYEPLAMDIYKKRELVKNSIIFHKNKGTKYVVESIIRILYAEDSKILEWYEYDGEPYFFKVLVKGMALTKENVTDIIFAIYELKNIRSWLEAIVFRDEMDTTLYTGGILKTKRSKEFINHRKLEDKVLNSNLYIGTAISEISRVFIQTLPIGG